MFEMITNGKNIALFTHRKLSLVQTYLSSQTSFEDWHPVPSTRSIKEGLDLPMIAEIKHKNNPMKNRLTLVATGTMYSFFFFFKFSYQF